MTNLRIGTVTSILNKLTLFSGQRYMHYANFFMTTEQESSPESFQ